jgi:hypothetical protein
MAIEAYIRFGVHNLRFLHGMGSLWLGLSGVLLHVFFVNTGIPHLFRVSGAACIGLWKFMGVAEKWRYVWVDKHLLFAIHASGRVLGRIDSRSQDLR